jgi:choice-of-anchor C domain-containing protein
MVQAMAEKASRSTAWSSGLASLLGGVLAAAAIVLPSGVASASSANLVTNGSFENPSVGSYVVYPAGSTGITGWTVGSGSVSNASVEQDSHDEWPADTGNLSVDLSGNAPGDLYQYIPTTPGATYNLSFALGGNFYCGQAVKEMQLTFGGTVLTYEFDDAKSSASAMHWEHESLQVTTTSSSTYLDFADITADQSSCGAVVDSVSVTPTPPPSLPETPEVPLLAVGAVVAFGGGAFLKRRRSRRSAA